LHHGCTILVGNREFLGNVSQLIELSPEMPLPTMVTYCLVLVQSKPEKLTLLVEGLAKAIGTALALEIQNHPVTLFDCTMVLLKRIIQILVGAMLNFVA